MRDEIEAMLARRGDEEYAGEAVSQLQHGLQAAALAEKEGAGPELITAALLHDIAHLFDDDPAAAAAAGLDTKHENKGAAWLAQWFGPEVTEPVRLHVDAKRWLCAEHADYWEGLSDASKLSLKLQGGPFDKAEADAWIATPYAREGVRLRHWDDEAKDPEAVTPPLAHYLDIAERLAGDGIAGDGITDNGGAGNGS